MQTFWLNPTFINWETGSLCWDPQDYYYIKRPYELLSHVSSILKQHHSELHCSDVIAWLKRALFLRVKTINTLYNFKQLPNKKLNLLEQLAALDIIKPIMLKQLIKIRNNIEHNDAKPPSHSRCEEFWEYMWYFLKATDSLVSKVFNDFEFIGDDDDYFIGLEIKFSPICLIKLRGRIAPDFIAETSVSNWYIITATKETEPSGNFYLRDGKFLEIPLPFYEEYFNLLQKI